MFPPGPSSRPFSTPQLSACCLRLGSWLLASASFTRASTASKSAVLSGLIRLNMTPESDVNLRDAGTAGGGPGATGVCAGVADVVGSETGACADVALRLARGFQHGDAHALAFPRRRPHHAPD